MVLSGGLLKVAAGIVASLVIAVAITGWMLKQAWEDNATLEANAAQYRQTIQDQNERYRALIAEKAATEKELARNAEKKTEHREVVEKVRYVTRTVQKEAEPGDCVNEPVPVRILECLRDTECGAGGSPGSGVSAGEPDAADP